MRQINDLLTIYNSKGRDYIHGLLEKFIVIKEKLKGTSIHFQYVNEEIKFFKGSTNKEISIIDRTLQSIYEKPIDRIIEQVNINYIHGKIQENYRFAFRYVPEDSNLYLEEIRIIESNNKIRFVEDPTVLEQWATEFNCNGTVIAHWGRLKKIQIDGILESLDNGKDDIYDILKANKNRSESLTMKFLDRTNESVSTKILNPTIKPTKSKERSSSDTYSIALQDVLAFMNTVNFDKFKPNGEDKSHRILNLISSLYAKYMSKNASKYEGMEDLDGPDFAKDIPDFGINLKNVTDEKAIGYIKESQINKEIFKLFLGTFTKKRKKTSILIDNNTKFEINKIIDMISDRSIDKPKSKESIPTFEDYYYGKYQKRALLESNLYEGKLSLEHNEPGKQSVNILVGRFQPPTLGHIKVLRQLHAKNNLPVVVIQVRSKSGKKTPFENETILKIWMDIAKQYKFIDAVKESQTGFLDQILNALRPEYEPVLWGTGSDRLSDYNRMIKLYGKEANVLPEFQTSEIKRNSNNISATQVREALIAGNEKEFKKLTPTAEHKFYDQLKNELSHSQ
jgi:phosphopantetheine adenylyltransferase